MPPDPTPSREPLARRLRGPAVVLLGLLALDIAVRWHRDTWERHSPDDYALRVRECGQQRRDFVLTGGSPVAEGLEPAAVAGGRWRGRPLHDGYTLGLSGATTSDVLVAVRHACPEPPGLLVYGITATDLNDARNEPHGPHSLMTWADLLEAARDRPEAAGWTAKHFLRGRLGRAWAAYHHRHGIRMWAAATADDLLPGGFPGAAKEARELVARGQAITAGRGYAPEAGFEYRRFDVVKAGNHHQPPFAYLDRYRTGSHLKALHALLDWADAGGADVVLLDMPVTADLEAKNPAAFAEYRERLAAVEAGRRVTVLRATREAVGLDDAQFADLIHLNRAGAEKLSAWLRDQLGAVRSSDRPPTLAGGPRP